MINKTLKIKHEQTGKDIRKENLFRTLNTKLKQNTSPKEQIKIHKYIKLSDIS